jgi:hypothetical protein
MSWDSNKIPISFTVNGTKYPVKVVPYINEERARVAIRGLWQNQPSPKVQIARSMLLGKKVKIRCTPAAMRKTFWHEAVHAILHEYEFPIENSREKLVDALAKGIVDVLKTGRFEGE